MKPTRDPKPGGFKSGDGVEKRRQEASTAAATQRESTVQRKRLRRDPSAASLGLSRPPSTASLPGAAAAEGPVSEPEIFGEALPTPQDIDEQVQTAVDAMKKAAGSPEDRLRAVKTLRQLLSNYQDPPYLAVLSSGGIPALISALQPSQADTTALETIYEAAWALTNLAVGDPQVVQAVVPAAPVLITYLEGGSGVEIAEQCAWALGNIAGEDAEHRATLVANGAVPSLTKLLVHGAKTVSTAQEAELDRLDGHPAVSAAATAAWALANLLRNAGQADVGNFMAAPEAPEALIECLKEHTPPRLAVEAAWVLAYVTAGPEAQLNRLVSLGIVPPLCKKVESTVEEFLTQGNCTADAVMTDTTISDTTAAGQPVFPPAPPPTALLTPLLRTLGNVAAGGGHTAIEQLLDPESASTIKSVVVCAESSLHGLQREAAWVLASVAGMPGRAGVDAIKRAGAFPVLLSLLKNQPFHVRKEAGFALANICAGGGGASGDAEAMNWLFGADVDAVRAMVSLMRSADVDAARLGLQFTEMLLRLLPNGVKEVEAADGIDAIETLQFGTAPAELQAAAAVLVDKYWGIDAGTDAATG